MVGPVTEIYFLLLNSHSKRLVRQPNNFESLAMEINSQILNIIVQYFPQATLSVISFLVVSQQK